MEAAETAPAKSAEVEEIVEVLDGSNCPVRAPISGLALYRAFSLENSSWGV